MLTKLIKYEWKSNWKIPAILNGIMLVLAVLIGLTFAFPVWENDNVALNMLVVSSWVMYYVAIVGITLGVTLYLAVRFYKSMYTDEGYLTHTLPVTAHQLLLAKGIHIAVWTALTSLAVVASWIITGGMVLMFHGSLLAEFRELWVALWKEIRQDFGFPTVNFCCSVLFMLVASVLYNVTMIMGSVSIGQNLTGHKVLGSIGAYFGLNTVVSTASTVISALAMLYQEVWSAADTLFSGISIMYWVVGVIFAGISVGLYFLSEYMTRKSLNLD